MEASTMARPVLSLIVVTKRPEFRAAWLHQVEAIEWEGSKELVVLEHVTRPHDYPPLELRPGRKVSRVVHLRKEGPQRVPELRTFALSRATGDLITWVDDDDWRHPRLLLSGFARMGCGEAVHVCGPRDLAYVHLSGADWRSYETPIEHPVFPGSLFHPVVKATPFPLMDRGSDTAWVTALRKAGRRVLSWSGDLNYLAVSHGGNVSRPEPIGTPLTRKQVERVQALDSSDLGEIEHEDGIPAHLNRLREREGVVEWEFRQ